MNGLPRAPSLLREVLPGNCGMWRERTESDAAYIRPMIFTKCLASASSIYPIGTTPTRVRRQKNLKQRVISAACTLFALDEPKKEALANKAGLSFYFDISDFPQYFRQFIKDSGKTGREITSAANISERMFRRFKHDLIPSKSSLTAIGISLGLSANGLQDLLRRAGYALSRSIASDAVVLWLLSHDERGGQNVSLLYHINETLSDLGLPILSTREKQSL